MSRQAVERRPPQAVSRLRPSPYNEHPSSARKRECGPVTTAAFAVPLRRRAVVTICLCPASCYKEWSTWARTAGGSCEGNAERC